MSLYDDAYEQTSYSYPWMHHTSASSLKRRIRSMTFLSLLPCVYYVCVREREREKETEKEKVQNVYCLLNINNIAGANESVVYVVVKAYYVVRVIVKVRSAGTRSIISKYSVVRSIIYIYHIYIYTRNSLISFSVSSSASLIVDDGYYVAYYYYYYY